MVALRDAGQANPWADHLQVLIRQSSTWNSNVPFRTATSFEDKAREQDEAHNHLYTQTCSSNHKKSGRQAGKGRKERRREGRKD